MTRKKGKKGNILFNDALNTFYFTVIWRRINVTKAVIGDICDSGDLCRYFDIYPMYSVAFVD